MDGMDGWYGHIIRSDSAKISLNIERDGRRPKGRTKQRQLDALNGFAEQNSKINSASKQNKS